MSSASDPRIQPLATLADRFSLADIYVFGSRAGEFAASAEATPSVASDSDVDIAVRPLGHRSMDVHDRVELTIALEALLGVGKVDLVVLPEASAFLALAAIRGNLLYCADSVDQAEYELYVLRRAGDLAPLERERQEITLNGGR